MKLLLPLLATLAPTLVSGKLLLDFDAARGDPPTKLGNTELESARASRMDDNSASLYIKPGKDTSGKPALHFHRDKGSIRAEVRALKGEVEDGKTYYISYEFAVAEFQESLMVWQFKTYDRSNKNAANIPLSLEVKRDKLNLQYQADSSSKRESQWSITPKTNEINHVVLGIRTGTTEEDGWVELYWNGEQQMLGDKKEKRLAAATNPGQSNPKFGAYRGEEIDIDTFIYSVKIGEELGDVLGKGNGTAIRGGRGGARH